jgi:short-subunit dehydrogenase
MGSPRRASAQHIVITGASGGLGSALAFAYAGPDIRLTLSGRREKRLADIAARCAATGAVVTTVVCDVTNSNEMNSWLTLADEVQAVDVVIANAGIGGNLATAPETAETNAIANLMFTTNTLGVVNTVTPLIPKFVARRAGHLVVISSLGGHLGLPHSPAYCGSKAAVRTYAEGLRRLLRIHGVQVTIVSPGFVDTPMSRSLPSGRFITWSAERAARAIKVAVKKGKPELSFPWPLKIAISAAQLLPNKLVDAVLAYTYRRAGFR